MSLKGKSIRSKATGMTGQITGHDRKELKLTFTGFQNISVPLERAEDLFVMDKEVADEIKQLLSESKSSRKSKEEKSKVETYVDDYEEEIEKPEDEDDEEDTGLIFEDSFEDDE